MLQKFVLCLGLLKTSRSSRRYVALMFAATAMLLPIVGTARGPSKIQYTGLWQGEGAGIKDPYYAYTKRRGGVYPPPSLNRLHSDDRLAVMYEAFYSLNQNHNGGSSRKISGWAVSDWNYMNNDRNAWEYVWKNWYKGCSSMWWGPHSGDSTADCQPNIPKGSKCFYHYPETYGLVDNYGRGGQCKYFSNLLTYRSGVRQKRSPSYGQASADYGNGSGPKKYTKSASKAQVGDLLYAKNQSHVAVVVAILAGNPAQSSVTAVDVVDSNWVGSEIICRHLVNTAGSWGFHSDLDNYFAVDLLDSDWP